MIRDKREKEAKKIKVQLWDVIIIVIVLVSYSSTQKDLHWDFHRCRHHNHLLCDQEEKIRRMALEMKEKRARQDKSKYRF